MTLAFIIGIFGGMYGVVKLRGDRVPR